MNKRTLLNGSMAQFCVLAAILLSLFTIYFHLTSTTAVCSTWPYCPGTEYSAYDLSRPNNLLNYLITGGLSSLLFVLTAVTAWRYRGKSIILGLLIVAATTTHFICAHASLQVQHDPLIATAHMALSFFIAGCSWWLWLINNNRQLPAVSAELKLLQPWAIIAICLLITEILIGTWYGAYDASVKFFGLPADANWLSDQSLTKVNLHQSVNAKLYMTVPFLTTKVNVQMLHRFAAYLSTALLVPFALCLLLINGKRNLQHLGILLLASVGIEFALGLASASFHNQGWLNILHTSFATILLLTLATIIHRLFLKAPKQNAIQPIA